MERVLVGIAGGTGSGKTTVAEMIVEALNEPVVLIKQDSYYKDFPDMPFDERKKINYDHPDAYDNDLLFEHLSLLLAGHEIDSPVYSFTRYERETFSVKVKPSKIIILEGILILEDKKIRDLLNIKLYVDTDPDIRLIRRILRDTKERGRSIDSVIDQYMNTVRPMHITFVEPTKRFADLIIPEGGFNKVAIDIIITKLKEILNK